MAEMLQYYAKLRFAGPLRQDHAPTLYGEGHGKFSGGLSEGYEIMGKVFAIGYLKGICEAAGISVEWSWIINK